VKIEFTPSEISGCITAPPSKSSMQRAIAAALLAEGESVLLNPSFSDDSLAAIEMAKCLGAIISIDKGSVKISGGLKPGCNELNCNESGLGVRLFSSIAALMSEPVKLYGRGSIMERPMDDGISCLRSLGVIADSDNGKLPLMVCGPIRGGSAFLDGSVSSQFLTGLLMALPVAKENSHIIVKDLSSRSYIDLTISTLSSFGIVISNENYKEFFIRGNQLYRSRTFTIEGDWSGAAFLLVMGALGGGVEVKGLQTGSTQPDRDILTYLKLAGAKVESKGESISVMPGNLVAFSADVSESPDLAPPLVALASFCSGTTTIKGTDRLKVKESNRGETLRSEFSKLGVKIENRGDQIVVKGNSSIEGGTVTSHGDHRIAMALSVVASRAKDSIIIEMADSINKSYPGFYDNIKSLGAKYSIIS
jgi:3-phosphoshikimate 1-carboxyvinyltransferase